MIITNLYEYLPTRYEATESEWQVRRDVWNFKDGSCSTRVLNALKNKIQEITGYNPSEWVVVFAPASTSCKTRVRYQDVAARLNRELSVVVSYEGLYNVADRDAAHLGGVRGDVSGVAVNSSVVRGKKVLIIDDVTTTGRSMQNLGSKICNCGAREVRGLVIAKTVNPDWQSCCA